MADQNPGQELRAGHLDSACTLTSAPTMSISETFGSIGGAVESPGTTLPLQDNPETNVMSLSSESLHTSAIAAQSSAGENSTQIKSSGASRIIQSVGHPVILGNINATNILSAAFINRSDASSPSHGTIVSSECGTSHFQNVLPLLIQQDLSNRNPVSMTSTSLLCLGNQNSLTSCSVSEMKGRLAGNVPISGFDSVGKPNMSFSESDLTSKPALLSSDTVLLSTGISSQSEALPISPMPLLSEDSITKTILSRDKSLFAMEKPFSLISDISDRSVSLESIPSMGVFNPSASEPKVISSSSAISGTDKVSGQTSPSNTLLSSNTLANAGVAIVGSQKIPQSVYLLVKQVKAPASSGSSDTLTAAPAQAKPVGSKHRNDKLPQVVMDLQISSQSEDSSQHLQTDAEDKSDTDTELNENSCDAIPKQDSLTRSDTVILKSEKEISGDSQMMTTEDTLIISKGDKPDTNEEVDKLSEGFSFKTYSTLSAAGTPESCSQADSGVVLTDGKSPGQSLNLNSSQLTQLTSVPLSVVLNNAGNSSMSDVFLGFGDGQVPMLRCLSGDLLDISGLLQMGQYNNAFVMPGDHTTSSSVVSLGEAPPTQVSAKETQTDIVFGTNTVYFQPSNLAMSSEPLAADNSQATLVNVTHSATHTSNIPATVMMPEDTSSGQVEAFLQPVSCPPIFQNQCNTQDAIIPEDPSFDGVVEDPCLFPCVNCEQTFRSKLELQQHERTHKKVFKCDLCNASFTRMGNFTRHRKIHNLQSETQNMYKCDDCGREFLQRCDLKRHLLIHAKKEPYRCEKCGKGYIRRSDLVVHMRFHNKDRAFKCSACDKKFFQTGDLNRHMRRAHQPNSQLTCGHCDRKYACETTLIRHMKASHKDIILKTVHQKLQETDSTQNSSLVNSSKIMFTMTDKKCPE